MGVFAGGRPGGPENEGRAERRHRVAENHRTTGWRSVSRQESGSGTKYSWFGVGPVCDEEATSSHGDFGPRPP